MRRLWKDPVCNTVSGQELSVYIKAAACSDIGICDEGVFR